MKYEYIYFSAEQREQYRKPCVYFAYEPGTNILLYVGCSDSIRRPFQPDHKHIGNHKADIFIAFFNTYREAFKVEQLFIKQLKPKLNCNDFADRIRAGNTPAVKRSRSRKLKISWARRRKNL
jgi:hypothetical protein